MGLVHRVVPGADLAEECAKVTAMLSQKSPMSIRLALQAIHASTEIDLDNGLVLEAALMTIATASDDKLTLAIDNTSHLPAWVSWMERNENLGDVTLRTAYTGYLPFKGIRLPMGYNTTIDFRNVTANKIYVDRYSVDEPFEDLAAPSDVRSGPVPAPPRAAPPGGPAAMARGRGARSRPARP